MFPINNIKAWSRKQARYVYARLYIKETNKISDNRPKKFESKRENSTKENKSNFMIGH